MELEKLYTAEEIANHLSIKKETVWKWWRNGSLGYIQIGSVKRTKESELKRYIEEDNGNAK